MSASFPPLPDELVEHIHGPISLLSGTCSASLVPESQRAGGVRVWPCKCKLTVLLPKATGEIAIANLRENPRIAVTMSMIQTFRTVQIKGTVFAVREADASEHELSIRYAAGLRSSLAWVGIPEAFTRGLALWPAWAVDVDIVHVFAQTPGPVAGQRMPLPAGTS